MHNGGADDAPNAWGKILKELSSAEGLEVKTEKTMIPADEKSLADHPFVFVHGRGRISFTEDERTALRKYLELGGFIFADSICASEEFADTFRAEMAEIVGAKNFSPLRDGHEIWTDKKYGETPLTNLQLRIKNPGGGFPDKPKIIPYPQMEGVEFGGRLAVLFSPYDLSCAMENKSVSDCSGYTREDATKIARRVVLYSLLSDSKPSK